jgi:D-glycero-D-manno-heptose 1,7-bisphosphate phosphatase
LAFIGITSTVEIEPNEMVEVDVGKRAFFIDRDGVINKSQILNGVSKPPMDLDSLQLLDGVEQAIGILKGTGIVPVVITNQPDVERGTQTREAVDQINKKIEVLTGITNFYVCYHNDASNCECRKPKIGMIIRASADLGIDVKRSFLIGDRWKDITAGQRAGVRESFFIDYAYSEKKPSQPYTLVKSLLEASVRVTSEGYT